jgi:hypothetical protein
LPIAATISRCIAASSAMSWSAGEAAGLRRCLTVSLGDGRHEIKATMPEGIGGTISETAIIVVSG